MTVDSQCHVSPCWYEPVEVLLYQMDRNAVDQAVLVQLIGQTNNDYQQDCIKRFPGRFSSVVWVDAQHPDACDQLTRLAGEGATGVRLRPNSRSPGDDPLAIWRMAGRLGLAVSCVGTSVDFGTAAFSGLVETLPTLPIVLEHLGGSSQPDNDPQARAARLNALDLAQFSNVFLKVPGLGELSPRKMPPVANGIPVADATPGILLEALQRFGPDRLMWGSDFPPVASREGYAGALLLCRELLERLIPNFSHRIFDDVARRVFRLPE